MAVLHGRHLLPHRAPPAAPARATLTPKEAAAGGAGGSASLCSHCAQREGEIYTRSLAAVNDLERQFGESRLVEACLWLACWLASLLGCLLAACWLAAAAAAAKHLLCSLPRLNSSSPHWVLTLPTTTARAAAAAAPLAPAGTAAARQVRCGRSASAARARCTKMCCAPAGTAPSFTAAKRWQRSSARRTRHSRALQTGDAQRSAEQTRGGGAVWRQGAGDVRCRHAPRSRGSLTDDVQRCRHAGAVVLAAAGAHAALGVQAGTLTLARAVQTGTTLSRRVLLECPLVVCAAMRVDHAAHPCCAVAARCLVREPTVSDVEV